MDDGELEGLVGRAAAGEAPAWRQLFETLLPGVERRIRGSRSFVGFRRDEDEVRNVVLAVFERLRRDECRALRLYQPWRDKHPGKRFDDWLSIVASNVVRDYVSARLGPDADGPGARESLAWGEVPEEASASGGRRRPGSATLTSFNQLAEVAAERLSSEQLAALDDWLRGYEFDELATRRSLASGKDAEKLVRAALARLRRHVGDAAIE